MIASRIYLTYYIRLYMDSIFIAILWDQLWLLCYEVYLIMVCNSCCRSHPLESFEDRIVVLNYFPIIEDESIVCLVVVGDIDHLGLQKLILKLTHQLYLNRYCKTCFPRLWHSKKSSCWTLHLLTKYSSLWWQLSSSRMKK